MWLAIVIFGSVFAGYGGLMIAHGDEFGSMLLALGVYFSAMGAAHAGRNTFRETSRGWPPMPRRWPPPPSPPIPPADENPGRP